MSETKEERTRKRRWLTLAEFVAVASVLIGAIGLYLSWSDRREAAAERTAAAAKEARVSRVVRLEGVVAGGGDALTLSDASHKIETIDVAFPAGLGVAARTAVPQPRIDKDWFKDVLLKATDGGRDDAEGRLPVLVTAYWWDADVKRSDRAIYDVAWRTKGGGMLQGRSLDLTGLVLRERGGSQARLDALWKVPKR
ncbi:MAG: hypothetical protein JWN21_1197 [Sphingomonas bacterium]|uniref:hypothetical protein n=1 Tax=Sphingomonas bacterium TaxID=1895847 RepID=UPI002637D60F|nr:hypothetical protein [Sphingomonas bacterium]MDB5695654.1 hypothetical protein [Sphingomonas bacterium]